MIYCSICGAHFIRRMYLVSHIRLKHQYSPNFKITCSESGCGRTFKILSSYTAHLSKEHPKHIKNTSASTSFLCSHCPYIAYKLSNLVSHYQDHMKLGISIDCPYEHCNKAYKINSSLRAHISKQHYNDRSVKDTILQQETDNNVDDPKEISNEDHEMYDTDKNIPPTSEPDSVSNMLKDMQDQFALFFLQLQAKYHVPASTITIIADFLEGFINFQCNVLKSSLLSDVREVAVTEERLVEIINTSQFNIASICLSLRTSFKRINYYDKSLGLLKPVTIPLGRNEYNINCSFQYVPLINSLANLMQHDDICEQVFKNHESPAASQIYRDFTDGQYFKSNVVFQTENSTEKSLVLLLYFDEYGIVNPIGAHRRKHKTAAFYYILGNLDSHSRSALHIIQLSIVCRNRDLKHFGLRVIMDPLLRDLKLLHEEGFTVDGVGKFKGGVLLVSGDNLGSHTLGGFTESFSPNVLHVCRTCMIPSEEIQHNFNVTSFVVRTCEMYDTQVQTVENDKSRAPEFGIKMISPLSEIPGLHVVKALPPDAMHDILEGILPYEAALVLRKLISDKYFTLDYLNRRILSLKYGKIDASCRPVEQILDKNNIIGTASTNWCLLRLLPIMIGSKIPENNEYWTFLLKLKYIAELVFAPTLSIGHIDTLQSEIVDHLKEFKTLFPNDKLKPKHHFLLHYPVHILNFGPPIRYWCFRFEAKHRFFKEVARFAKQFKNPPFTLATNHQLLQCFYHQEKQGFLKSDYECQASEPAQFLDKSVATYNILKSAVTVDVRKLFQTKLVKLRGTTYTLQMFVVIGFSNADIVFGEINQILTYNGVVWFLVKKHNSVKLNHYGCYKIVPTEDYECILQSDLVDFYPLSRYLLSDVDGGISVVSLKHFVFNELDYMT